MQNDEVLRLVARRIQKVIRKADVLGRSADDEGARMALFHLDGSAFSLLINRIPAAENAAVIAKRIINQLRVPMRIAGDDIYVTASIGIATNPPESDEAPELLRLASSAKDYAKKLGGNSFQFSSAAINTMYEKPLKIMSLYYTTSRKSKLKRASLRG